MERKTGDKNALDLKQSASAAQFNRQSDRYGKSHILADTQDLEHALRGLIVPASGTALDVATGGGHTALWLARHGWEVTAGDIAPRMLENAQKLCAEAGFRIETRLFPAEEVPFADGSFDLITVRVAPHHFSSPQKFVQEAARVLRPGGHFLLIDGTVPDDDPETDEWLHRVEKWRDPSHGRFLSRKAWQDLAEKAGLKVVRADQVVRRAFAAGVRMMLVTGTSVAASEEAVRIAREYPGQIFATAGVHPHDSRNCTEATIPELRRLAANREVVAIGECGLDFNRNFSPRPEQEKWFEAQVVLAEELQMPLFLHDRDARERFCQILGAARKSVPAVIHCFTGSGEDLNAYLDMGLHVGITGWICDERRGTQLRELVKRVPLDHLMLETDAPFLVPRTMPQRAKDGRNEPAFLPYILQTVADCLGIASAEAALVTTQTARQFFRLQ